MPPNSTAVAADVGLVGARRRVERQQRDVVAARQQLAASALSRKQLPQYIPAAPAVIDRIFMTSPSRVDASRHRCGAVWNARARNRKSTMLPSCGCSQFSCDRRHRPEVQPVDVRRRRSARAGTSRCTVIARADQRRADRLEHLRLRALDHGDEREHVFLLGDRRRPASRSARPSAAGSRRVPA